MMSWFGDPDDFMYALPLQIGDTQGRMYTIGGQRRCASKMLILLWDFGGDG